MSVNKIGNGALEAFKAARESSSGSKVTSVSALGKGALEAFKTARDALVFSGNSSTIDNGRECLREFFPAAPVLEQGQESAKLISPDLGNKALAAFKASRDSGVSVQPLLNPETKLKSLKAVEKLKDCSGWMPSWITGKCTEAAKATEEGAKKALDAFKTARDSGVSTPDLGATLSVSKKIAKKPELSTGAKSLLDYIAARNSSVPIEPLLNPETKLKSLRAVETLKDCSGWMPSWMTGKCTEVPQSSKDVGKKAVEAFKASRTVLSPAPEQGLISMMIEGAGKVATMIGNGLTKAYEYLPEASASNITLGVAALVIGVVGYNLWKGGEVTPEIKETKSPELPIVKKKLRRVKRRVLSKDEILAIRKKQFIAKLVRTIKAYPERRDEILSCLPKQKDEIFSGLL